MSILVVDINIKYVVLRFLIGERDGVAQRYE